MDRPRLSVVILQQPDLPGAYPFPFNRYRLVCHVLLFFRETCLNPTASYLISHDVH